MGKVAASESSRAAPAAAPAVAPAAEAAVPTRPVVVSVKVRAPLGGLRCPLGA